MREITPRQQEFYDWIAAYIAENGYSPSYTEIANAFSVHRNSAFETVRALAKKGALTYTPKMARTIRLVEEA